MAPVDFLNPCGSIPRHDFNHTFMSQDHLIVIKNKETGETYWTRKNRKSVERKLEFKKYSPKLRKHITFKEAKK